ncbi:MAG: AAA family ATPase [Alphaproteobacteria bacterium]|nr:AAA family ATPase [Alphaproteobacteria bacterium]
MSNYLESNLALRNGSILPPVTLPKQCYSHTTVIESNDPDTTIGLIKADMAEGASCCIIDVSELRSADLLVKRAGEYDSNKQCFIFSETNGALRHALDNNQNIILKGHFSAELCDALAPLLIARSRDPNLVNKLILLSDGPSELRYLPYETDNVGKNKKCQILGEAHHLLTDEQLEKEPLRTLEARLRYLKQHPEQSSEGAAWAGVYTLPNGVTIADFDLENSADITQAFKANRLSQVNAVLEHSPFVLLTGLTGVGKTTFVQQELVPDNKGLYEGVSQLSQWAKDKTPGRKILFIDEANITTRNWSEFEGLFDNNPPSIVIDGVYHELTADHKVVFAANPLSYGAARTLPTLFKRHGNAVLFEPMPAEMIYETQLKPLFKGSVLEPRTRELAPLFLNTYRDVCSYSKDEVLISPREVQMMALLTLAYCKQRQKADPKQVAHHYAYRVAHSLVPANYIRQFEEKHKPEGSLVRKEIKWPVNNEFVVTPSRYAIAQPMNDLLNVRLMRQADRELANFPGLGGIVLEGKPGVGKSELVFNLLKAKGYVEASQADVNTASKIYYVIPASMQYNMKRDTLLKAFNEGAVVVMDEFNCASMMESLLNALLNGKTPEGQPPQRPGFTIIGTQNPPSMAGRALKSHALSRRLMADHVPEYTKKEVREVLSQKGVESFDAKAASSVYVNILAGDPQTALSFRELVRKTTRLPGNNKSVGSAANVCHMQV